MLNKKMKTKNGTFNYFINENFDRKNPTIFFWAAMGINSSYFDYFNLFKYINTEKINLISVDQLGSGFSGYPNNNKRTLENYSTEMKEFIGCFNLKKIFIVAHSFSGIYSLNILNNINVAGFIGIDPTSPKIIKKYENQIQKNLNEALESKNNNQHMDTDINPSLPSNIKSEAMVLYKNISGNEFEINELQEAHNTINKMLSSSISDKIPTLTFLSTLNLNSYKKYGNPYFNKNVNSSEIILNGHHFLQWLHPKLMATYIATFIDNIV
ncbi:alpha/beta hydrolase [Fructilactobacillus florum]|nr:alpha/beta hydrolase [Fructilactobacillus florum]